MTPPTVPVTDELESTDQYLKDLWCPFLKDFLLPPISYPFIADTTYLTLIPEP